MSIFPSIGYPAVLIGLLIGVGSTSTARDDGDQAVSRSQIGLSSSAPSRWWRTEPNTYNRTHDSRSSSAINADLRHYQWQLHQRQRQQVRVKSEENNRKLWLTWNGAQDELDNDENKSKIEETITDSTQKEAEESLSLLENLVHPEEELLDEINDRQIIQAVIASMAQWNLRKLQKMQRKSDQNR